MLLLLLLLLKLIHEELFLMRARDGVGERQGQALVVSWSYRESIDLPVMIARVRVRVRVCRVLEAVELVALLKPLHDHLATTTTHC